MDTTSISELERQEHEALAALKAEFPAADIRRGCDRRYAVQMTPDFRFTQPPRLVPSQWWEYDTLPAVRQRIVWALANR